MVEGSNERETVIPPETRLHSTSPYPVAGREIKLNSTSRYLEQRFNFPRPDFEPHSNEPAMAGIESRGRA